MPQMTRPAALPHPPEPDWQGRLDEIASVRRHQMRQEWAQLMAVTTAGLASLTLSMENVQRVMLAQRRSLTRLSCNALMCRGDHDPL